VLRYSVCLCSIMQKYTAQQVRVAGCTVVLWPSSCRACMAMVFQQRPENNQENAYRTPRATKGFPFVCLAPGGSDVI
jgi:hypothetical protein